MYTLIAGTGEKLVFNRPNQKGTEKSRAVVFHAFIVSKYHPFTFLSSAYHYPL